MHCQSVRVEDWLRRGAKDALMVAPRHSHIQCCLTHTRLNNTSSTCVAMSRSAGNTYNCVLLFMVDICGCGGEVERHDGGAGLGGWVEHVEIILGQTWRGGKHEQ